MVSNNLGIGLISDRQGRNGRVICLVIQRLGIIHNIQVINGEVIFPVGKKFTNRLRERITGYLGV